MSSVALSGNSRAFSIDPADLVSGSLNSRAPSDATDDGAAATALNQSSKMYYSSQEHENGSSGQLGDYRAVGEHEHELNVTDGTVEDTHGQQASHMYGSFVGYCFTVNYILGVGVLGMPFAFYKAGWALSTICLGLVTVMASFTALWLVDVSLRAQYIKRQDRLLRAGELDAHGADALQTPISHRSQQRFEMNELVELFIGVRARRIYETLVIIYLVGALWSYTSVFASSMASHVGIPGINGGEECDISTDPSTGCSSLFYFYVGLFSCVAVPLTCLDLAEMKAMQIALAIFRFVSLATMMATSLAAIYSYPSPNAEAHSPANEPYISKDFKAFDWSNLGLVFPVAVYSQIFHHSAPGLSYPLTDKRTAPRVFIAVLVTTMALYTALGVTVSAYYGASVSQPCTIAWAKYSGGHDGAGQSRPGWASFIGYLVVLFPPIDIISAFPLNAITLGNNLLCAFVEDEERQKLFRVRIPFRLLAAIPPIVGACIVRDLDVILKYTGCVGVLIAFAYPCMLQYYSVRECERRNLIVQVEPLPSFRWPWNRSRRATVVGAVPAAPRGIVEVGAGIEERVGTPSYNAKWVSQPNIVWVVAFFSVVGLVAVLVLSIVNA